MFQIALEPSRTVGPLTAGFSPLRGPSGTIPIGAQRCISLGGIDDHGTSFHKALSVTAGERQVLWCGIDVPPTAKGVYWGRVDVGLGKEGKTTVALDLQVSGNPVSDHGAADAKSLARLRWLDSTAGQGRSIVKPYAPVRVREHTVSVLGRDLVLGPDGLPAQIVSHFSGSNTRILPVGKNVLAAPFSFVAGSGPSKSRLTGIKTDGYEATWTSRGAGPGYFLDTRGRLDFTGSGQIAIKLTAQRDLDFDFDDIHLDIPYTKGAATYLMGLNRQGGLRPASVSWKWDTARHQDCFWMGAVNAGLMIRLKDQHYRRPLVNIYYKFRPLLLPESWGGGGVRVFEQADRVIARSYSGPKHLRKGQSLDFVADIYLTPFRTIDTDRQWQTRFVHPHPSRDPKGVDDALASADPVHGPNVLNVHQATYYNPYINYPFSPDSFPAFADLVKRAHQKGIRARVYYTTREITQNMPELFALHSLNGEVVFPGPGKDAKTLINPNGPNQWLVDNLGSDFIPAWVDHVGGKYADLDISVITTPDSRWNNFYIEGLKWMVDKAKIDGVYIDDTALDALSLQRARRILAARPNPVLDLHSWNHFNEWAGYANNLNMYMEVLPYLDRLWLGEGFSADAAHWDYWLVEMSGLPFGLMSEMLDSPNPSHGFVFGETGRLGWSGDPRPMWRFWDQAGMRGKEMIGFFDPACPVKTSNSLVKASVYRGKGDTIVALANFSNQTVQANLAIDWKALGLAAESSVILRPKIGGIQEAGETASGQPITVGPNAGAILVLRPITRLKSEATP